MSIPNFCTGSGKQAMSEILRMVNSSPCHWLYKLPTLFQFSDTVQEDITELIPHSDSQHCAKYVENHNLSTQCSSVSIIVFCLLY